MIFFYFFLFFTSVFDIRPKVQWQISRLMLSWFFRAVSRQLGSASNWCTSGVTLDRTASAYILVGGRGFWKNSTHVCFKELIKPTHGLSTKKRHQGCETRHEEQLYVDSSVRLFLSASPLKRGARNARCKFRTHAGLRSHLLPPTCGFQSPSPKLHVRGPEAHSSMHRYSRDRDGTIPTVCSTRLFD